MNHIHEGANESDKPAKFLFMDIKVETEVELWQRARDFIENVMSLLYVLILVKKIM